MTSDSKTLFRFLLLLLCAYPATAQKLTFQQMGVRQGLPASEVYNFHQDNKGYVWAFTEYGIVRHNGTRFIPACTNLPLSESAIYKVAESPSGELYLANSQARIYKVVNGSAVLIKGMERTSAEILAANQTILHLFIDEASDIWFSTHNKSYRFSARSNSILELCRDKNEKNEIIFKEIGGRHVVLKCIRGEMSKECLLTVTDRDDRTIFSIPYGYFYKGRNGIIKNGDRYYIMTADGLILVRPSGRMKQVNFPRTTLNIQLAPDGHIWVGMAYGGLYELDADLRIVGHYLDGIAVSDILFDDQQGIWVSTIGRGVYYCRNRLSVSYNDIPELSESITLLKVARDKLFIGTASGDLFVLEKDSLRKIPLEGSGSCLNDVLFFEGHFYIGLKSGSFEMDASLKKAGKLPAMISGYAFAKGGNGELLIVSASRIYKKEASSDQFIHVQETQKPRGIVVRADGSAFVSTREGLLLLNEKLTCPAYLEPLRGKNISRLTLDKHQNMWICTKGAGVYCLSSGNKLKHFTGIPSLVTMDILFLPNNTAVLATNKGAYVSYLKNGAFSSWIQLLDEETIGIALYGEKLYFGTKLGLTILEADQLLHTTVYPFYLSSVISNGKEIDKRNIRLDYDHNELYFNFDLLAYQVNAKRLFYRLDGPSPAKGIVDGTQLHFQNLVPGAYTLHTYPVNYRENNHQTGITLRFYIAPAFWQTKLFIGSTVFLVVLLIVVIIWWIFSRARQKADQRSRITKLLAGYRLTALKAQINPHFISNSLSAIQQLILSGQTDRANHYMAKFSLLIRYLLNYSDKAVASLGSEIRIIDLDIELEQLRFSDKFVFRKEIAENVDPELLYIPPLITQPFIENAIWHGLLPLTDDRIPELVLKVALEQNYLTISIIDNGVGRSKPVLEEQDFQSVAEERESKGTGLIRNRIDNLNLLHTTTNGAVIELIDLQDEQGNATGTQVNIVFSVEMLNKLYDEQDQEHYY